MVKGGRRGEDQMSEDIKGRELRVNVPMVWTVGTLWTGTLLPQSSVIKPYFNI